MRFVISLILSPLILANLAMGENNSESHQAITLPREELVFDSADSSQPLWQNLFTALLDNDKNTVAANALKLLETGNVRDSRIVCRLGFLLESNFSSPTQLLDTLEAMPPSTSPQCQYYRADLMMRLAANALDVEKCEHYSQYLGYIKEWTLLGDINSEGRIDLEKEWGPEKRPDSSGITVAGIHRDWITPSPSADGWINLKSILTPNEGLAYAIAYINLPAPGAIQITCELEGSGILYVDGYRLYSIDPATIPGNRIRSMSVQLSAGFHRLAIKSIPLPLWYQRQGFDWGFRIAVTTPDLQVIDRLIITRDLETEKRLAPQKQLQTLPSIAPADTTNSPGRFITLLEGIDSLAQGNLDSADSILTDLDQRLNHNPLTSWMLAEELLAHADPALRMQAAIAISHIQANESSHPGIRLLRDSILMENQRYDDVLDDLRTIAEPVPSEFYALQGSIERQLGLLTEAEKHLRVAANAGNTYACLELARVLINLYHNDEASLYITHAISNNLSLRTQLGDLYDNWIFHQVTAANSIMERCLRLAPYDLLLEEAVLEAKLHISDFTSALSLAREMIQNHPFAENGYRRLAELSIFTGEKDAGIKAAKAMQNKRPGNEWASQYLQAPSNSFISYAIDFSNEELIGKQLLPDPAAKVTMLLQETIFTVREDYSFDELTRKALRLESDESRDFYGEIPLPNGSELLVARVITTKGEKRDAAIISDPSGSATISFRGLEKGCIIEYAWLTPYSKRRIYDIPCFYFFATGFASINYNLVLSRIVVNAPAYFPIESVTSRFNGNFKVQFKDGRRIMAWEVKNLPRIIPEPDMPSAFYIGPVAQASSITNLSVIDGWFQGVLEPAIRPDESVSKRAITITNRLHGLEEKASAVFRYVDETIETNNGTILNPAPARETLINHWGRGIDRAVLILAMLRAVGVESYLALLNSSPDLPGEEAHPTLAFYDSALVYIPNQTGREIWLDPNIQHIGFGQVFETNLDKEATIFMGKSIIHKRTPKDSTIATLTIVKQSLTISPEGLAVGVGNITWQGLDSLVRNSLTDPHTREKDSHDLILSYLPDASLDSITLENIGDPDKPLISRFSCTIPHLALASITGLEVTAGIIKRNLASQYVVLPTRKYPMILDRTFNQSDHFELTLPEGWLVTPPTGSRQLNNEFGEYRLEWNYSSGKLTVDRLMKIPKRTISPASYQRFAEFCRSVDETDSYPIHLNLR